MFKKNDTVSTIQETRNNEKLLEYVNDKKNAEEKYESAKKDPNWNKYVDCISTYKAFAEVKAIGEVIDYPDSYTAYYTEHLIYRCKLCGKECLAIRDRTTYASSYGSSREVNIEYQQNCMNCNIPLYYASRDKND